jgi:hypothetical protein
VFLTDWRIRRLFWGILLKFIPCAPTGTSTELKNAYNEILGNVAEAGKDTLNEALPAW